MCYDALLLFGVLFAATIILLPLTGGEAIASGQPLYTLYLLGVGFLYFGWFWTHGGQTLGMRAWGVRLVGSRPSGVTWIECLVRFLAALISLLALGMGFIWAAFDRQKRGWHDLLSGTRLVVVPAKSRADT